MAILTMLVQRKLDKRLFKGASAPPAPDPYATADAQKTANIDSARASTAMSRYDQVTPYGTTKWSQDPANQDKWTSTFELDPAIQNMLSQYQGSASQPLQTVGTSGLQGVADASMYRANSVQGMDFDASQNLIDRNQGLSETAGSLANQSMTNLGQTLSGGNLNYDNVAAMPTADLASRQAVEDAYYNRQTSRLNPEYQAAESALRSRLANEGITQGSEAYNREIDAFGRTRNDAYANARNDSVTNSTTELGKLFNMGMASRQQGVSEANYLRDQSLKEAGAVGALNSSYSSDLQSALATQMAQRASADASATSNANMDSMLRGNGLNERLTLNSQQTAQRNQLLNELMAITTGSQIQGGGAGQVDVAAAPIAQSIYNTYQGQLNAAASKNQANTAMWTGIGQLASSAAQAYAASDISTKQNIVRVGDHKPGIGLYEFEYKPAYQDAWGSGRRLGVLAQEVAIVHPEAVAMHQDGYLMVDYAAI